MKKPMLLAAGAAIVVVIAAIYWMASPPRTTDPNVIATNGLHWHAKIEVYVNGVPQPVPPNIGIGAAYAQAPGFDSRNGMAGMHTHDPEGTVHLEGAGTVTRDDITLGTFFRTWGKTFDDFGTRLNMNVNGIENNEGEAYEMQDGDQIILSFFP
ncbi:MAG: hypothetical protein JJ919_16370 [Henriciella sp.]|nr:hypothetical protein [Henriciella sp.]